MLVDNRWSEREGDRNLDRAEKGVAWGGSQGPDCMGDKRKSPS